MVVQSQRRSLISVLSGLISPHLGHEIQKLRLTLGRKESPNPDYSDFGPKRLTKEGCKYYVYIFCSIP